MKKCLRYTVLSVFIIWCCSLIPLKAGSIAGGLPIRECLGAWCPSSNSKVTVVTESGTAAAITGPEANYSLYYEGHAFFPDGRSVLVAVHSHCFTDDSDEECLLVAVFNSNGSLIKKKTFTSTYRQTDPNHALVTHSSFTVAGVSIWNNRIVISLGVGGPFSELLILDDDLNVIAQVQLPSPPVALAGPWVVLYNRTVLDLNTGRLYEDPYKEYVPYHAVTEVVSIDDGLALFYSAPTGLNMELYAFAVMVKRDGNKLRTVKSVILNFNGGGILTGAPGIMNAFKDSNGWTIHVRLWKDFGGNVEHCIVTADSNWENFRVYAIRGANKRLWEGYLLDWMGDLSGSDGSIYFALSPGGKSVALLNIRDLPLKEENGMSVFLRDYDNSTWEPVSEAQLQSVSYVVECEQCISFSSENLDLSVGIVHQPTLFYLNTNYSDQSLFADFFCYGPQEYKTYCGMIVNGQIWLYDASIGTLVPFEASQIDEYIAVSNSDDLNTILHVKVCEGTQAILPPLSVNLFAVSVPQGVNLSTAIQNGDYLMTIVPWRTPDCM